MATGRLFTYGVTMTDDCSHLPKMISMSVKNILYKHLWQAYVVIIATGDMDMTAPKTDYEAGYCAFSEDADGAIARAVADHFSGKMHLDSTKYSDEWHNGYQDATDDFNNAQQGAA